jgi:hypothetical protein
MPFAVLEIILFAGSLATTMCATFAVWKITGFPVAFSAFAVLILFLPRLVRSIVPLRPALMRLDERSWRMAVWRWQALFRETFLRPVETVLPAPFRPLYYRMQGSRVEFGAFVSGRLIEPYLIEIRRGAVVGDDALLMAHAIVRGCVQLHGIILEEDSTVGARAVVMPGCRLGRDAVLASGAVLPAGSIIPPGETWAGIPARAIRTAASDPSTPDIFFSVPGLSLRQPKGATA